MRRYGLSLDSLEDSLGKKLRGGHGTGWIENNMIPIPPYKNNFGMG